MIGYLDLMGQPVVDLIGDGDLQATVQGLGFLRLLQAFCLGADLGAPAAELAGEIQLHMAFRGADHPDELTLFQALPAAHTLPLGNFLLHKLHLQITLSLPHGGIGMTAGNVLILRFRTQPRLLPGLRP